MVGIGNFNIFLSQNVRKVCQKKDCYNRSIFGKDMDKRLVALFTDHGV